jgi:flagellar hook-associated protein FlgK
MVGEITENNMADYNLAQSSTLSPEDYAQQQQLNRQQQMAAMLMQQGMQQPQGQMVSGRYVPTSFFQNLVPLANLAASQYIGNKADTKAAELAQKLREGQSSAMSEFLATKQGKPAVVQNTELAGPYAGNVPQPMATQEISPAQAPNPQAAYANLYSNPYASSVQKDYAFKGMTAPPEEVTLSEGAVRYVKNPDGTYKAVATGGEKLYTVKGNLVTASGKKIFSAGEEGGEGFGIGGSNVNNNGMRVGKYDKMGRYISPTGQVYPASAVTEARAEHDAATDLAYKLNQLNKQDVNNAYGSLTDYTTSKVGRMAGPTATLDAQTKINNIGINNTLNNLSRLKGASSDKEMAQMIKDFPGYEAPPSVMNSWVERASKTTNRFLKRSEGRFGFDTEYAEEGRFGEKPKEQKGEIAAPGAPKAGEIRQGYRFKGGDQYDQNNWEKVK